MNDKLYNLAFESIQAKFDADEITIEEAEELNNLAYARLYEEKVTSPIKKYLEELKFIKDARISEYDGDSDIKEYVDKNYDKIKKVANLLEDEGDDLTKEELKECIVSISGLLASYVLLLAVPGNLFVAGFTFIATILFTLIHSILMHFKKKNDVNGWEDLAKIKKNLQKIKDNKKVSESVKKKAESLITDIEFAVDSYDDYEKKQAIKRDITKTAAMVSMANSR